MPRIRMNSGTIKEVSAKDAKILIAIKKAVLVVDIPEVPKAAEAPQQVEAPAPVAQNTDAPVERQKRAYRRKDMQAGA